MFCYTIIENYECAINTKTSWNWFENQSEFIFKLVSTYDRLTKHMIDLSNRPHTQKQFTPLPRQQNPFRHWTSSSIIRVNRAIDRLWQLMCTCNTACIIYILIIRVIRKRQLLASLNISPYKFTLQVFRRISWSRNIFLCGFNTNFLHARNYLSRLQVQLTYYTFLLSSENPRLLPFYWASTFLTFWGQWWSG